MRYHENKMCRVCGSNQLSKVMPLNKTPIGDNYFLKEDENCDNNLYDLSVFLCEKCELLQLTTVIEPDILYPNFLYRTNTSLGLSEHFFNLASRIIDKLKYKDGLIVDIGSNDGSLLKGYKSLNFEVLGIEPAKEIAQTASDNGIFTLDKFFNVDLAYEIVEKYGKAIIVNCNNTMANIDELNDFINGIKILLDESGTFIFETSYLPKLIENMVFDSIYHEHLSYFSLKPLEILFKQHNMILFDAEMVSTKGGSIRCFVQHYKEQKSSNSLNNIRSEETLYKLCDTNTYKVFMNKIDNEKRKLLAYLELNKDLKLYGYGASQTTTTLLYHFEISKYFQSILDDNKIKIGRFSPGSCIPIISSKAIYDEKPDIIVIFAWRYADIIINKHKKFIDDGGVFIIPLPEFRIVQ